jgi:hypothetical protein
MEYELAPAVLGVVSVVGEVEERGDKGIDAIIVAGGTVAQVPWGRGVLQAVGVDGVVVDRSQAFDVVRVAGVHDVDTVLVEDGLEGEPAVVAESAGGCADATIHGTMAH